jgi:hypothetical protein
MNTYKIILSKKCGLFAFNLGEVKANDKRAAEKIGREWCDAMDRPQWKSKIKARQVVKS